MSNWKMLKKEYYKKNICVIYSNGIIDFSEQSMALIVNGSFKSYNEYLDVQEKSCHQCRTYFCDFYYSPDSAFSVCNFYGQIERFVPRKNKVVFKRIMIDGIVSDGPTSIKGKEDHVWMDMTPFQDYAPGDCLRFHADIYRYMKTGTNGKLIDYSLRNPHDIKTSSYKIPSDDEIINQQLEQLVCETCMYHDHCYFNFCMDNEFEKKERFETLKNLYDYSLKISR